MSLNFPVLYPDELVYSSVARSGIRSALASHKQLLDQVYGNRKVVATMDLPCQLDSIEHHLERTGRFSLETLLYKHTLLPLYAPFVDEEKRQKAITLMASKTQGAVHMMLGVAASRLKGNKQFCFCEDCYEQQLNEKGEGYWLREWFLPGLTVCTEHQKRLSCFREGPSSHRHSYQALYPPELTADSEANDLLYPESWLSLDVELAEMAKALLNQEPVSSPSKEQWSAFYMKLAHAKSFTKGKKVLHEQIYQLFIRYYPRGYLASKGLDVNPSSETNWLKTMFRKHRKSFSYLEHLMVWKVFMTQRKVSDILKEVGYLAVADKEGVSKDGLLSVQEDVGFILSRDDKRKAWSELVMKLSIKPARQIEGGGGLYAWLYRHDKIWLLDFNRVHQNLDHIRVAEPRVNWVQRDRHTVRALFKILHKSEGCPVKTRQSGRWFLEQLPKYQTLSKNLHKLPLTQAFLERYSETITEYQLRRALYYVCNYHCQYGPEKVFFKPWKMLRGTGLSKERMTLDTENILRQMGYYF